VPIEFEAEQALIKGNFPGKIFDDETGVKDARAGLVSSGREKTFAGLLDEG